MPDETKVVDIPLTEDLKNYMSTFSPYTSRGDLSYTEGLGELKRMDPDATYSSGSPITPSQLFNAQSGKEILGRTLAGFGTQLGAGFMKALGSWDVKGIYNTATGNTNEDYGNFINDMADDLLKYSSKEHNIYSSPKGDIWNSAWLGKTLQSSGLSAGIILESLAEQVGLGLASGGSLNTLSLSGKANMLRSLITQGGVGAVKGLQETYINSLETGSQVEETLKAEREQGLNNLTDEQIRQQSNEAATLNFRAESLPLMSLNALQYGLTFGAAYKSKNVFERPNLSSGWSGGLETASEKLFNNISNPLLRNTAKGLFNPVTEGVEEGVQTAIQKYAYGETLDRDVDYLDNEMRDATLAGMLTGGLFSLAGSAMSSLNSRLGNNRLDYLHNTYLNETPKRFANSYSQLSKAENDLESAYNLVKNDPSERNKDVYSKAKFEYEKAQNQASNQSIGDALYLDYITNRETAFQSSVEQMENIHNAVVNNDVSKLREYGLIDENGKENFPGSFDMVKESFPKRITQAKEFKDNLQDNLFNVTGDFESALDITKTQMDIKNSIDTISSNDNDISNLLAKDVQYNQMSSDGQRRFRLEFEKKLLDYNKDVIGITNKEILEGIQEQLEEAPQYTTKDKGLLNSIDTSKLTYLMLDSMDHKDNIDDNNIKLRDLKDSNQIKQRIEQRKKSEAEKITKRATSENKEEVKSELERIRELTPENNAKVESEALSKEVDNSNIKLPVELEGALFSPEDFNFKDDRIGDVVSVLSADDSEAFNMQPHVYRPDNAEQSKIIDNYARVIRGVADNFKQQSNMDVSPKEMFNLFADRLGIDLMYKNFELFKEGYRRAGLPVGSDFDNVLKNLYSPLDELGKELTAKNTVPVTIEQVKVQQKEIEAKEAREEFTTHLVSTDDVVTIPYDGPKVTEPVLKVPYLGMPYEEVYDPIRNKIVFYDSGTELNFNGGNDLNVMLNYKLLLPGDTFEAKVDDTWIEAPIGTQDYIDRVPIRMIYKGVDVGYALHETNWWKTSSTADFTWNPELSPEAARLLQEELIKKGRELTRATRKAIIDNGGRMTMEITNIHNGFTTANRTGELRSVSEANPESVLAYAQNGNLMISEDNPFKDIIVNKDNLNLRGATIFMLSQTGYKKVDGQLVPIYEANELITNKNQAELKEYSKSLGKIYNAIDVVLDNAPKGNLTVEMANNILDRVASITKIRKKELLFKTGSIYKGMEDVKLMFPRRNRDNELFIMYDKKAIGKDMPVVNEDGSVTAKSYNEYVKENTHTPINFYTITDTNGSPLHIKYPQRRIEFKPVSVNSPITTHNVVLTEVVTEDNPVKVAIQDSEKEEVSEVLPVEITNEVVTPIGEITSLQRRRVIQYLYNKVLNDLSMIEDMTTKNIIDTINSAFENHLESVKNTYKSEYQYLLDNKDSIIGSGKYSNDFNTVKDNIQAFLNQELEEDEETVFDEEGNLVKNTGQSSFEVSVKTSIGTRAKMFFAGTAIKDESKTISEPIAGLPEYYSIDDVFDGLQQILVNVPNDEVSVLKRIEERIALNPKEFGFLSDIFNKLSNKSTPIELRKQLLYRLNQTKVDMFFGMFTTKKDGTKLESLNSNSRDPHIALRLRFRNIFRVSPLVNFTRKGYTINKDVATRLLNQFEEWKKSGDIMNVSNKEFTEWLGNFGIVVDDVTAMKYKQKTSGNTFGSGSSLQGRLYSNLKSFLEVQEKEKKQDPNFIFLTDYTKGVPHSGLKTIMEHDNSNFTKDIIRLEVENTFTPLKSMYIAGKTINSYSQPNFTSEQINRLKMTKNRDMVDNLLSSPFSRNSLLLNLINDNPRMRESLGLSFISLEAIKQRGQKVYQDANITSLSGQDLELALLAHFVSEGAKFKKVGNFNYREAKMSSPALSDSSQMFLLNTPVLHLTTLDFDINDKGEVFLSEELKEMLYTQLMKPDLDRIVEFVKAGVSTNIVGQDLASQIFTVIPTLNTLRNQDSFLLKDIHKAIHEGTSIEDVVDRYRPDIYQLLEKVVKDSAESKIRKVDGKFQGDWVSYGFVNENGTETHFLDTKYLNTTGGKNPGEQVLLAAYDYVINYQISQAQWQMLFAGDFSNYYSDGKNSFEVQANGIPNVFTIGDLPVGTDMIDRLQQEYNKVNSIAKVNLSKRLKALLSPGNRIANSFNQETDYKQLMASDVEGPSSTIKQIAKLWYPDITEENLAEFDVLNLSISLYNSEQSKNPNSPMAKQEGSRVSSLTKKLSNKFPDIAGYIKITGTDAQEYTTWQEHLHILLNQGLLNEEVYKNLKEKLKSQSKGLNNTNKLTKEEKKIVFQPIKPLHTGMYFTDVVGRDGNGYKTQRFVYVKTSSFPLLPEMTYKSDLDNVRINLERLQEATGQKVRMSYQSGNKVGAIKRTIPFSRLTNIEDADVLEEMMNSSVTLKRENFSIQQDKPFKTDKNIKAGKRDEVNRGTQFEDIILGNDINHITDKIFPNTFDDQFLASIGVESIDGNVSGEDLYTIYNSIYKEEQAILKRQLYESLGLDKNGQWEDSVQSLERIKDVLNRQLTNQQDKDILELTYIVEGQNENGSLRNDYYKKVELESPEGIRYQVYKRLSDGLEVENIEAKRAEFNLPLWITPNSRKFESVLNSIVGNKMIKLKLPGFSSPVASEQGFKYVNEDDYTKGGIIYTEAYDPIVGLKATHFEDGTLKYAQVLVANKFRGRDGKLIKLPTKKVEDKTLLDMEKIDKNLLSMFSFRIPTSAHQSGAIIEIVGFLPHSQGDLMIVPKDHTTQIGEDYDIDTRYIYSLNTVQDSDGKLRALNFSDIPIIAEDKVEKIYQEYKTYKEQLLEEYLSNKQSVWYNNREMILQLAFAENELEILQTVGANVNNLMDNLFGTNTEDDINELQSEIAYLRGNILPNSGIKEKQSAIQKELEGYLNDLKRAFKNERSQAYRSFIDQKKIDKAKSYALENQIINLFKSIYSTKNADIQKTISSTLSTDFAEDTANLIDAKLSSGESYPVYDDRHQKKVLKLGASGKMGIGVHSNWVVLNSVFQQMKDTDKPKLIKGIEEDTGEIIPFDMIFGRFTTDGQLGLINGIGPSKMTTTVGNMINQNSSTDNQKLQIMGRRNENKYTISVFSLMYNLGILDDTLDNGQIVGYADLFISQPIIRRYVELKEKYESISSEYNANAEKEIDDTLLAEFGQNIQWATYLENGEEVELVGVMDKKEMDRISKGLTAQTLYDNLLVNEGSYLNENQWAVYEKFKDLNKQATNINKIQQLVNIEGKGLGISFFDVINKKDVLINVIKNLDYTNVLNADKVFGNMKVIVANSQEEFKEIQRMEDEGYVILQQVDNQFTMIQPTTPQNQKLINSTSIAYNLWKNIFPFENTTIEQQINGILDIAQKDPLTRKGTELKYKVISSIQDYIYSWRSIGNQNLFSDSITNERKKLFMRDGNSTPLAVYLDRLKREGHPIFKEAFFKDLEFELGYEGEESLIKYSLNEKSNFNKNETYKILKDLTNSSEEIEKGKSYTYTELMRDLLKYSLLSNQENGAIGYRQYIPVDLMEKYGITTNLKTHAGIGRDTSTNLLLNGDFRALMNITKGFLVEGAITYDVVSLRNEDKIRISKLIDRINSKYGQVLTLQNSGSILVQDEVTQNFSSTFIKQFFQHNPEEAVKLNWKNKKEWLDKPYLGTKMENLDFFTSSSIDLDYVTIRDSKNNKFLLYQQVEPGVYQRINTLGAFGINEYDPFNNAAQSMFQNNYYSKFDKAIVAPVRGSSNYEYIKWFGNSTVTEIIEGISASGTKYSDIANMLLPFVEDKPLIFSDLDSITPPDKLVNGFYLGDVANVGGAVNINIGGKVATFNRGTIYINTRMLRESGLDREAVEYLIMEEMLHSVTTDYVKRYVRSSTFDNKGKLTTEYNMPDQEVPIAITKLVEVYRQAGKYWFDKTGGVSNESVVGGEINRISDIYEFITGIIVDEQFRAEMAKVEYKGESIVSKFAKAIKDIFQRIFRELNLPTNNIAENGYNAVMNLLSSKTKPEYPTIQTQPINTDTNTEAELLIGEDEGITRILGTDPSTLRVEVRENGKWIDKTGEVKAYAGFKEIGLTEAINTMFGSNLTKDDILKIFQENQESMNTQPTTGIIDVLLQNNLINKINC